MAAGVLQACTLNVASQHHSPLFSEIPGEIRNLIYEFALSDYEDANEAYGANTCYKRPGYYARRRTDTALLSTCQMIYREAWFIPWTLRQHTLFFTQTPRKPRRHDTPEQMAATLESIHNAHGERATEIKHMRLFAQLFLLEDGGKLGELLTIPHFNPKCFTITLRHTDWWFWESDTALYIDSAFVNRCEFPDSVTEICMELESIERRRPQIQDIAQQMREKWAFRRRDGNFLTARKGYEDEVMRWEGSSTWNRQRWLRDETKPDTLEYYVQTVRFRVCSKDNFGASVHFSPRLDARGYLRLDSGLNSVRVERLQERGIGEGFTAIQTRELLNKYRSRCLCARNGRQCCGTGLGAGWASSSSESRYCQNCEKVLGCRVD